MLVNVTLGSVARKAVCLLLLASICSTMSVSCRDRVFVASGRVEGGTPRPVSDAPAAQLIGTWKSDPYATQLGQTIDTLCFAPNGKVKANARTQAGVLEYDGAYTASANEITFTWSGTRARDVAKYRWQADHLILTNDRSKTIRYQRVPGSC